MSEMLGPPPAYAEAISSSTASSTRPASASASNNGTIWTIPVSPPDIGQLTPPPSYAETLRANPGHGRCSRCARVHGRNRQGQGQRGQGPLTSSSSELAQPNSSSPSSSFPSFLCSRHLHRCPSRQRHNGNIGNGLNLVFPADRHRTELARRASRDVESLGTIPEEPRRQGGGSCADKFRDVFLTILMRVLLIFLFVVFMRILIAQLSPEET